MQKQQSTLAEQLAGQILASAQTVADLKGSDPRTVKKNETPIAYLQTPNGVKSLYALSNDLLEIAKRNAAE